MAWARFSPTSHVYVYEVIDNMGITCCGCLLGADPFFDTFEEMADHLEQHVALGHPVPENLIADLRDEHARGRTPLD